jgi:hypothetical protein
MARFVDLTSSPLLINAVQPPAPPAKDNVDTAQLLNELNSEFSFNEAWETNIVILLNLKPG